jgi:hypothetical protein
LIRIQALWLGLTQNMRQKFAAHPSIVRAGVSRIGSRSVATKPTLLENKAVLEWSSQATAGICSFDLFGAAMATDTLNSKLPWSDRLASLNFHNFVSPYTAYDLEKAFY